MNHKILLAGSSGHDRAQPLSCMYPRNHETPLTEDMILTGELEPTNEGYASAKIDCAGMCDYITRENLDFQYKTLIPCNVYGRRDKFVGERVHMILAVTFIASSNACLHAGLKPVFVDVDAKTYNIDPAQIEAKIDAETVAIMPVHLFGQPCEMDPIVELAAKYNLKIIEDCAEAHFATYKGKPVGSFGAVGCFSTYVAHTITTGVGGVVTTNDRELMEIFRSLIAHGRACTCEECVASNPKKVCPLRMKTEPDKRFMFIRLGYSYRIVDHSFMMYPLVLKEGAPFTQREIIRHLEKNNIETRPMMPLLNQPLYKKLFGDLEKDYPVAEWINHSGFYVGCHHGLERAQLDKIIDCIRGFLKEHT